MNIHDYQDTAAPIDHTPRPRAAQAVAARKRAHPDSVPSEEAAGVAIPRQYLIVALLGGMLLFVIALSWQLTQPARPLALTPVPTTAATEALVYTNAAPATSPPAARTATLAPRAVSTPVAPPQPAQSGRGMGVVEVAPAEAAPSYIENVGRQSSHTPRGGVTGPCDGACAVVPTAEPAMLEVIGRQTPHKIR